MGLKELWSELGVSSKLTGVKSRLGEFSLDGLKVKSLQILHLNVVGSIKPCWKVVVLASYVEL